MGALAAGVAADPVGDLVAAPVEEREEAAVLEDLADLVVGAVVAGVAGVLVLAVAVGLARILELVVTAILATTGCP